MVSYKATVSLGSGNNNICNNCIKADVCKVAEEFEKEPSDGMYIEGCDYFIDRNQVVELPCRCGQCREYKLKGGSFLCVLHISRVHCDDFCSYGVQRSDQK